ncbi:hypothetical protein [Sphingomonas montana]|uniref:hypothetical protein n=1 Tax=Sphingomonas montana TaxID=1843236 RepID=UPI0013EBBFF8|nr:hypothetical protein [Sphingomonas montana]
MPGDKRNGAGGRDAVVIRRARHDGVGRRIDRFWPGGAAGDPAPGRASSIDGRDRAG